MQQGLLEVGTLVDKIDAGEIRLPEIQRAYVWKGPQVAHLVDSLYRRYPSGSLLLWEADQEFSVAERSTAIASTSISGRPWKPLYLLDGQQRITSLHRVLKGHPDTSVVFNVAAERFQLESRSTTLASGWVKVTDVIAEATSLFELAAQLAEPTGLTADVVHGRLDRLRGIAHYSYQYETVQGLDYEEVTSIFIRVNSKGRPLKATDLALASLSARWAGAVGRIEGLAAVLASKQFGHLDVQFLVRALAALTTQQGGLGGLSKASIEDLDEAWVRLEEGLQHAIALLEANAGITSSKLIASATSLIPVVAYLALRQGEKVETDEANGLIYWLIAVGIGLRYSAGKETRLAEDLAAVRSEDPLRSLLTKAGLTRVRVDVRPEDLEGKTTTSPYFALAYLTCKNAGATDWFHGVALGTAGKGAFKLEYHHIHPRKTLKGLPRKQINDLANLAFISAKANRKIAASSPASYFSQLADADLDAHFVPRDPALRSAGAYPEFLEARRGQLAEAMTAWLLSFRPSFVVEPEPDDRPLGVEVTVSFVPAVNDQEEESGSASGLLAVTVTTPSGRPGTVLTTTDALEAALDASENGLVPTMNLMGTEVGLATEEDPDQIGLPVGDLRITGTAAEWRAVLDRERAEPMSNNELVALTKSTTILTVMEEDGLTDFFVMDTD